MAETFIRAMIATNRDASETVNARCPACGQNGTFEITPGTRDMLIASMVPNAISGQRVCPNRSCRAVLYFAAQGSTLLVSYPPQRLDFDATNLPEPVCRSLEEAISCHAHQCFIAAAIMVRKSLEELCRDRGAVGATLKDRIRELGNKVVLPRELLDGLDDLRLLGNDAAHVESQVFNQVGKEEVEIGIEFAKEVLKAVYQYSSLLDKLRSLKKP